MTSEVQERLAEKTSDGWEGDPITLVVPPWGGISYRGLASSMPQN